MDLFDELKERGYIYQTTDEERTRELLSGKQPFTFYLGIDPTADSLHIGHFFALMLFRHLQRAGHRGILLVGGATAMIGDPSGKSDMRKMLSKAEIEANIEEVATLAQRFIRTDGENPAIITNNAYWLNDLGFIDFMREVGIHFNINRMLAAESYAKRLEEGGLTFLEMSYMLMQAYDFVHLNRTEGCVMQIGGSDQWGNIVAGTNLSRKFSNLADEDRPELVGLTCPLLMTNDGKKMGKTEKGTLWVAREKTSVYDFYQYFYNVDDGDVEMLLRLFTDLPLDEVKTLCATDIVKAKQRMAYETTALVHGVEEADKVLETVRSLFGQQQFSQDMPTVEVDAGEESYGLLDLIITAGFAASRGQARRLVDQRGISLDGVVQQSAEGVVEAARLAGDGVVMRKGKKDYMRLKLKAA